MFHHNSSNENVLDEIRLNTGERLINLYEKNDIQ